MRWARRTYQRDASLPCCACAHSIFPFYTLIHLKSKCSRRYQLMGPIRQRQTNHKQMNQSWINRFIHYLVASVASELELKRSIITLRALSSAGILLLLAVVICLRVLLKHLTQSRVFFFFFFIVGILWLIDALFMDKACTPTFPWSTQVTSHRDRQALDLRDRDDALKRKRHLCESHSCGGSFSQPRYSLGFLRIEFCQTR